MRDGSIRVKISLSGFTDVITSHTNGANDTTENTTSAV
jgi:hypothetical protein